MISFQLEIDNSSKVLQHLKFKLLAQKIIRDLRLRGNTYNGKSLQYKFQ